MITIFISCVCLEKNNVKYRNFYAISLNKISFFSLDNKYNYFFFLFFSFSLILPRFTSLEENYYKNEDS